MPKKPTYEELRHDLDTKMLQASSLPTDQQKGFINRTFTGIYKAYQEKHVNHADYLKLINRLAAYQQGKFNDYMDILAGAAMMGMLDIVMEADAPQLSPEAARQRRQEVTDLTGVEPIEPEE